MRGAAATSATSGAASAARAGEKAAPASATGGDRRAAGAGAGTGGFSPARGSDAGLVADPALDSIPSTTSEVSLGMVLAPIAPPLIHPAHHLHGETRIRRR